MDLVFEPPHIKTMARAPSEDSDQPEHPPGLIRIFAVHMNRAWVLNYPLSAQRRLCSDWAHAQADLSLRWAHLPLGWFCHEAAHLSMHIQNFIKIHPFVRKILRKNTFLHQSRAITLLFMNEFSPFAIPNHSFLVSISVQSLKKIGQKLLKLESGNDTLASVKGCNSVVYERI